MTTKEMTFGLVSESKKKKAKPKREPVGMKSIAGGLGIYIYDIEYGINDEVIWGWSNDSRIHRSRIYDDREGNPYFNAGGSRQYLNEFLRKGTGWGF